MLRAFSKAAERVARAVGTPWAFLAAGCSILVWALSGPAFGFSDTWQLVVNTATTIITFLMVFLIQNTQNRDNAALHAKLDELILATGGAENQLIEAETLTDDEIARLREHISDQRHEAGDTGTPQDNGSSPPAARTAQRRT